jgi:hypothetical protein
MLHRLVNTDRRLLLDLRGMTYLAINNQSELKVAGG